MPIPGLSSLISIVDLETDEEHGDESTAHQTLQLHEFFNQLPRSETCIQVTITCENRRINGGFKAPGMLYRVDDKFYVRATGMSHLWRAFPNGVVHIYPEDDGANPKYRVEGTWKINSYAKDGMRNKGHFD